MKVLVVLAAALAALLLTGVSARHVDSRTAYKSANGNLRWGPLGHYFAASLASSFLTDDAQTFVQQYVDDGDMASIASWADDYCHTDDGAWSAELHYINTPDWDCTYNRARDCQSESGFPGAYCVDGAIQNFTSQLGTGVDLSSMRLLNDDDLTMAFKFIVHFIGDIHQPLHVGFAGDEGGNTEKGSWLADDNASSTNNKSEPLRTYKLHQIWDTEIISKRLDDDYNSDNSTYVAYLLSRVQKGGDLVDQVKQWQSCSNATAFHACSDEWAQESVKLTCSNAEVNTDGSHIADGFDLEDDYYQKNMPIVEVQLIKAGVRMANVINELAKTSKLLRVNHIPVQTAQA